MLMMKVVAVAVIVGGRGLVAEKEKEVRYSKPIIPCSG